MNLLTFILISLMVVSTASAAMMGSNSMPMKISGGEGFAFAARSPGGCHFEQGKGVVCMGLGPHRSFATARNTTDECYFDKVKGAICPGRSLGQGMFVSRRMQHQLIAKEAPARLSLPPPVSIQGNFKGPLTRRHMQNPLRIGQNVSSI